MTPAAMLHDAELVDDLERRFVTVNDDVHVSKHAINVLRPRSAEDLIDEADFERDERLPYWAELWPSSTVLADFALASLRGPRRTIELGCGIGLVSIAAALAGHDVLATDYYAEALDFVRANAFRNLGREFATSVLDWRDIPDALGQFQCVLASDVLYESRYADIVAQAIVRLLAPDGEAYIADPGRIATSAFGDACERLGTTMAACATRPYLAGKIRQTITIYRITR